MDEVSLAFAAPEARAIATAFDTPLDRISVRDYLTAVELGAFQSERDVTQRIRFNVVVEVAPHGGSDTDDVDMILSYDTITEAIDGQLRLARFKLLETLAERIAEQILLHRQAIRVFVRIEKLDRIPGTLGVEIIRHQEQQRTADTDGTSARPLVVLIPNGVLHSKRLGLWLDQIAALPISAILCLEQSVTPTPHTGVPAVDRRLGLLAMEQNAWLLAGLDRRCVVVDNRTELDWAVKNGQLSIWAPTKLVLDAAEKLKIEAENFLGLVEWFGKQVNALEIVVCEECFGAEKRTDLRIVPRPDQLMDMH